MILSSLTAVLQVVLAVCICSIASQKIPSITAVTRDLSFLISHLLLPCLTFYNVAESLNIELLLQCSVLVVFSVVFALIGMVLGSVASALLFRTKNTGIPPKLQRNVRFELLNRVANASDPVNCGAIDDCKEFVLYVVVRGPVIADGFDARELVSSLRVPDEEYEKEPLYSCATILAMSVQNAITAPLSLIQAISMSMDWVDMGKSTSYIFMYSIVVTVVLWGVGPLLVSKAKRETERRHATRLIMEKQMRLQKYRDVTTQTEVRGAASHLVSGGGSACTPQPPSSRAWERVEVSATRNDSKAPAAAAQPSICKGLDSITHRQRFSLAETGVTCQTFPCDLLETGDICVVDNRQFQSMTQRVSGGGGCLAGLWQAVKRTLIQICRTPACVSVFVGIFVGLIPPLQRFLFDGLFAPLTGIMALIARASIPSSIFLLGANFSKTEVAPEKYKPVRLREAEQNTEFPLDDMTVNQSFARTYNQQHENILFNKHASFARQSLCRDHCGEASEPTAITRSGVGDNTGTERLSCNTEPSKSRFSRCLAGLRDFVMLRGVPRKFMISVISLRLLVMPLIGYSLVLLLRKFAPSVVGGAEPKNLLLLVLLAELASPSAINCNILFTSLQYSPHVWARMLFYQYVCCILSLSGWFTVALYMSA